jgi:hypothetical protein
VPILIFLLKQYLTRFFCNNVLLRLEKNSKNHASRKKTARCAPLVRHTYILVRCTKKAPSVHGTAGLGVARGLRVLAGGAGAGLPAAAADGFSEI